MVRRKPNFKSQLIKSLNTCTNKEPIVEKLPLNFPGTPAVKDLSSRDQLPKLIPLETGRGMGGEWEFGLGHVFHLSEASKTPGDRVGRKKGSCSQHDLYRDLGQEMTWLSDCCYNRLCVLLPFVATQTLSGK